MRQHEDLLARKPFHLEVQPYIHVVDFLQVLRFIELGEKIFFFEQQVNSFNGLGKVWDILRSTN